MWSPTRLRPRQLTCFYCLSPTPTSSSASGVLNPYYWKCPHCEQWNRRDVRGEIVQDPAAGSVYMNHASWQRRASLPDNAFPPGTPWSPFCTQCVTNQKLIVEMLANYLPDESDPSHSAALANLPGYRTDLERRYPPLCEECRPRVEEELKKHSDRAMSDLRASIVAERNGGSGSAAPRQARRSAAGMTVWEGRVWRIRGFAWVLGLVLSVARDIRILVHPSDVPQGTSAQREALLTLASAACTTWNPKWLRLRQYTDTGTPVHMFGSRTWLAFQLLIFLLRTALSLSFLAQDDPRIPTSAELFRLLAAITLTADTLLNIISYRALHIRRLPAPSNKTLPPLGPAPPRQTFHENAFDGLRLSDSPMYTNAHIPSNLNTTPRARTVSPRFAPTQAAGDDRPSSLPPSFAPPRLSPSRLPSTPSLGASSVVTAEESDSETEAQPMEVDPPPRPIYQANDDGQMKPQTYPERYIATGLEDLVSNWNLSDPPAHPPASNDPFGTGAEWQEVGLPELVEVVALSVGWAVGGGRAIQVAWACVGVVGVYRLGQRKGLAVAVAAAIALMRAALPLPLLATGLGVSEKAEGLVWDGLTLGLIASARMAVRRGGNT